MLYFALTTLSTVGYGDLYPTSIMEKLVGVVIEIGGVTFFSILMANFTEVTMTLIGESMTKREEDLQNWFKLIKLIRN